MAPPPNPFQEFMALNEELTSLVQSLPTSIPATKAKSRIVTVFTNIPVPKNPLELWEVFDKRFNALFGEDLRDVKTGRLPNVQRGKHGLDLVLTYIREMISSGTLDWGAAIPKMQRLVNEVKAVKSAAPAPKSGAAAKGKKASGGKGKGKGTALADVLGSDDEDDGDYAPPRRERRDTDDESDGEFPKTIHDVDGEEFSVETDAFRELMEARTAKKAQSKDTTPSSSAPTRSNPLKRTVSTFVEVADSGDESDGGSALRKVNATATAATGSRRGPKSAAKDEFKPPYPDTVKEKGKTFLKWVYPCKHCGSKRKFTRTIDYPGCKIEDEPHLPKTSNLAAHLRLECKPYQVKKAALAAGEAAEEEAGEDSGPSGFNTKPVRDVMAEWFKKGELDPAVNPTQAGFLKIFALWILDEDLPWTTGEAPMLHKLFRYLKIKQNLPSDTTVRNELARIYADLHGKVVREFATIKSRISYSTDTWTTRQMTYTFACTMASFIDDDWNLIERVIDFKALEEKEHEGVYAARAFVQGARGIGCLNKMNNATTNDEIFRNVSRYLLSLYRTPEHADRHIRCLAHVINLVVQAILAGLDEVDSLYNDPVNELRNDDLHDYYLQNKDTPIHYDVATDPTQDELEAARDDDMAMEFLDVGEFDDELLGIEDEIEDELKQLGLTSALKKLRFIVKKITSSPQRRQRFYKFSEKAYGDRHTDESSRDSALLRLLMVVRDVRTRWNSTYAMLARALLLREAIDEWVIRTPEYRHIMLSKDEWKELEGLEGMLSPFTEVTKQISGSTYPTIPFSLPIYYRLHSHLSSILSRPSTTSRIRSAVALGLSKLNKYKTRADDNHYLKVAAALHPSMRAAWFAKTTKFSPNPDTHRKDQEKKIDDLKIIFNGVAEKYQAELAEEEASSTPAIPSISTSAQPLQHSDSSGSFLADFCDVPDVIPLDVPTVTPAEALRDELSRYWQFEGGRGDLFDPLAWWKKNAPRFPVLSQMARDYLAMPATSVSVERTFSKSRRICTELRSSLHTSTVTQSLLTKLWINNKHFDFQLIDPPLRPTKRRKISEDD